MLTPWVKRCIEVLDLSIHVRIRFDRLRSKVALLLVKFLRKCYQALRVTHIVKLGHIRSCHVSYVPLRLALNLSLEFCYVHM